MPNATVATIADRIVADLSAVGALSLTASVARRSLPLYKLETLKDTLHVSVVPRDDAGERSDRVTWGHEYEIDIGVQKKVPTVENVDVDPLLYLVQQIADFYDEVAPSQRTEKLILKRHVPLFNQLHLKDHSCFTSVIRLTFKGWR